MRVVGLVVQSSVIGAFTGKQKSLVLWFYVRALRCPVQSCMQCMRFVFLVGCLW